MLTQEEYKLLITNCLRLPRSVYLTVNDYITFRDDLKEHNLWDSNPLDDKSIVLVEQLYNNRLTDATFPHKFSYFMYTRAINTKYYVTQAKKIPFEEEKINYEKQKEQKEQNEQKEKTSNKKFHEKYLGFYHI